MPDCGAACLGLEDVMTSGVWSDVRIACPGNLALTICIYIPRNRTASSSIDHANPSTNPTYIQNIYRYN